MNEEMVMKFIKTMALATCLVAGCSSLSEYSNLPGVNMSALESDFSVRTAPVMTLPYCIKNTLDTDIDVAKIDFQLSVNGLPIEQEVADINKSIDEYSELCQKIEFCPDVVNDARAASTVLNSMLKRTYKVDAVLYFDDDETMPVTTSISGELK